MRSCRTLVGRSAVLCAGRAPPAAVGGLELQTVLHGFLQGHLELFSASRKVLDHRLWITLNK